MATPSRIEGDVYVSGNIASLTMAIPSGTIIDDDVNAAADIVTTKMQHQYAKNYSQAGGSTSVAEQRVIHTPYGATGTVVAFVAGVITLDIGASTTTVDLKKNGTSVLSAVITLDSGNTVRVVEAGTISTAAYVAGDCFEVVVACTPGGGTQSKGVYAQAIFREKAQ